MRVLTWSGDGVEFRDAPAPSIEADGDALVRPVAVATCDLDATMIAGETPFPAPIALGHECVAEVVETGDAVRGGGAGARGSAPCRVSWGECPACRRGHRGNCRTVPPFSMYGFGQAGSNWGGFLADAVRV